MKKIENISHFVKIEQAFLKFKSKRLCDVFQILNNIDFVSHHFLKIVGFNIYL